jgi:hypothetical protein
MKKFFCVFISVLLALSCVVSAGADVIFEPRDSFYETLGTGVNITTEATPPTAPTES